MNNMRNTNIPWIGEIPLDWNLIRFKDKFSSKKEVVGERVEEYERLALTLNGVIKRDKNDDDGLQPADFEGYQIIENGDFIFKMIDLQNISTSRVGLSSYTGLVSPAYIRFVPKDEPCKFTYYFLMSMYYNCVFNNLGGNGVRSALSATDMGNLIIPYPSKKVREAISNQLDSDLQKIEQLISNIDQQLKYLQEYKYSLIIDTVFEGVGKEINTVEELWFKKLPANWKTSNIGAEFKVRNTKVSDIEYQPLSVTKLSEGVTLQLNQVAKSDAHDDRKLVKKGDFVINSRSDRKMSCGVSKYDGSVSLINIVLEPSGDITSDYCHYLLKNPLFAEEFYKWGHGIVADLWTTNASDLKRITIPVPPKEEQKEIVEFLNNKCSAIERIIAIKEQKIEKLNEYKKSLIYEYVTGKRQVE